MSLLDPERLHDAGPYVRLLAEFIGLLRVVLAQVWRPRNQKNK